ncbi:MAG: hypothetical protein A3J10_03405 [Candidatus Sungbacteria bacterium RIFCSPLOWO2_02_FULL_54_10]|uniref:Uncharacterized protein n=2 Tax=Candidatus Sungiibacteriota TaxID=1817917 RepID=A0A1G2L5Q5_9BACT|nr:MAG: hypothetical protein A2679_03700 [Candidatus Sungbacteria bacterium RIFCSPHIGHO2_01_FULL_54_26]OHA03045.1 MAG: hypothetical protein A3C92_00555 [Candidatus Sungbacteria bacterium RIFCSPHIGHO2_02_FULL_53_17]OHA06900.1 MAG: hypothetical protein A3B34_03505 [Candidatus Sungbacteria bacterium RIFCSPLOWO2_01_FULL_54_21]OHA13477.1 MAG: hypothetical protein A3J10_03405 [Candidatus Sungbacteria bacterium RIFCSPLOWO2_02_FULL_54_10]
MDILEQYERKHPLAPRKFPTGQDTSDYRWVIRVVMHASGGMIANVRQANIALLVFAIIACIATLILMASNFNLVPPPHFSDEDARKQIEEYRNVQPF